MNIFVLGDNECPKLSAVSMCDKHVVKMCLESAQLLSSVWSDGPYKRTHYNHPCAVWVRSGPGPYFWLLEHFEALLNEYTFRYGKVHACQKLLPWLAARVSAGVSELGPKSDCSGKSLCVADDCKATGDTVTSYRSYYIHYKAGIAKWSKGRSAPSWWPTGLEAASAKK